MFAGWYPELAGQSFSIVVDASEPVVCERAMYFGLPPERTITMGSQIPL